MTQVNRREFLRRAASLIGSAPLLGASALSTMCGRGGEGPASPIGRARAMPFGEIPGPAEQVMVAMRDGVRLATDLHLPSSPGRLPAILIRLPYDKSGPFAFMPQVARHLVDEGYAAIVQDVRGKIRSEGAPVAFVHEVEDGFDTLEWLIRQPWSNGTVGMFGDSYYGFTQWAAAASRHKALRCMAPRMTSTEIGTDWMYCQGVFCLYTMLWWASLTWVDERLHEGGLDWSLRPLQDILPAAHGGRRSRSFDRWIRLGPDDPYWTDAVFAGRGNPRDSLDIPALHAGGWWDVFQRGQLRDYHAMRNRARAQHLEMGSRDHWDQDLLEDGETAPDLHDAAVLEAWVGRYLAPAARFFGRYLRGDESIALPAVRWHLANSGWRESVSWPPPGARPLTLYPAAADRAAKDSEGGALAPAPDAARAETRWTHDAADPVPCLTPDAWASLTGLPDERTVEARPDVLTFTAEPIAEPLDLAGPMAVRLRVASSAPSAHVMAKLVDVYPTGRARRVADGAALLRDASAGGLVTVSLGDTGYRLRPGHRLRLEIASSHFPRFLLHPGDGRDPWTVERGSACSQTLATGGSEPSALTLTVLDQRG